MRQNTYNAELRKSLYPIRVIDTMIIGRPKLGGKGYKCHYNGEGGFFVRVHCCTASLAFFINDQLPVYLADSSHG